MFGCDPLLLAFVLYSALVATFLASMDIHNASRALWSAYGQFAERVKHASRRSSQQDLVDYGHVAEMNQEGWETEFEQRNPLHGVADLDSGRFSEAEFLEQFGGPAEPAEDGPLPDIAKAVPMETGNHTPELSEPSDILDERQTNALAAAVPIRHRWRRWSLAYSTSRDGISLRTLYRNSARVGPNITIVRDKDGHVFGCFCSEGWKLAPRYYGSGECFVFQLKPEMLLWRWYQKKMAVARNDYFQFSTPDCLAVGGAPAYAVKLDGDLALGRSGISETFGNAPLAGAEEFQIGRVEVWALV